jgi:hypothetical protein
MSRYNLAKHFQNIVTQIFKKYSDFLPVHKIETAQIGVDLIIQRPGNRGNSSELWMEAQATRACGNEKVALFSLSS